MLSMVTDLRGFTLRTTDGDIGSLCDFYFDDVQWQIRYLVVDTGNWLRDRQVLIAPESLDPPSWVDKAIPVRLTKRQVEESPPVEAHQPLTRRHERELAAHYRWPSWWGGTGAALVAVWATLSNGEPGKADADDSPLSSMKAVIKYRVADAHGTAASVDNFLLDDEKWIIRYVIAKTGRFFSGRKVLIASEWIKRLDWRNALLRVDFTREKMLASPTFDLSNPINRRDERILYGYYGRTGYWDDV